MDVKVTIGPKRTRFKNLTEPLRKEFDRALSYSKPGARFSPSYKPGGKGGWDGRTHMMFRDGISTGLFLAMKDTLKKQHGLRWLVKYDLPQLDLTDDTTESDREFQNEVVQAMIAARWGGLVLNATGSGKTYIAALFLRKVAEGAVFIVDELTLLAQAREELSRGLGGPVGIIGKSEWEPQRVTVATIQTLHSQKKGKHAKRWKAWADTVGVCIVDEIHQQINKRNFRVIESLNVKRRYGLTATLQIKHKNVRLRAFAHVGPVLYEYTLREGVKEGYLSEGIVVMADVQSDGVENAYDYHSMYESFIMENRRRNVRAADIARAAHDAGHAVVIICDRPAHVRKLSRLLNDIPHRVAHGAITSDERIQACKLFDAGSIRLLIVNRVFKKGINLKRISFIVECSGLKDPNDAIQKFGRGVRLSPNKEGLIYVDIRDTMSTLGRAYENVHPYTLAAKKRRRTYKDAGIKVLRAKEKLLPGVVVRQAEKALRELINTPTGV